MKALIAALALAAACGGSSQKTLGSPSKAPTPPPPPQCTAAQACVQATGGDKCVESCAVQADCPAGQTCMTWEVCCSGTGCTAALAHVCCAASGC